ncbi:MAG: right-handed parallel beta-helix repeat-containing protein, partial [Prosthecobacter sp.]|nr:right-handed parallel beta-helix repeat-containing protein [Prosthecobacter sp.]
MFNNAVHLRSVVIAASAMFSTVLHAATYYVDAINGQDDWSGKFESRLATDGPWRTIGKVSRTFLAPGDKILFKCGHTWHETLRINASGTVSNPIIISSYPSSCLEKPLIDGSIKVPAHEWKSAGEKLFYTDYPFNLVRNGDFEQQASLWGIWSEDRKGTITAKTTGCTAGRSPCLNIRGSGLLAHGLANSQPFELESSRSYTVSFSLNLPKGKWIKASVRRNTAPWDLIGNTTQVQGNGTWQTIEKIFRPTTSIDNARLDIEFTGDPDAYIDDVRITPIVASPKALYISNIPQTVAHHPNRGHDRTSLTSPYYRTVANSNNVLNSAGTAVGSSYIPFGTELNGLTSAQLLDPKTKVYVRTTPWVIEDFSPVRVESGKMFLDRVSRYPILKDFGYFLTGALWMLDEPGEWVAAENDSKIYVSPSDELPPISRATITELTVGVDVSGRSNVHVQNIAVRQTEIGINISNAQRIEITDCSIDDTTREGISASGAQSTVISRNVISNTGLDAITALQTGSIAAFGITISDNKIRGSGVRVENGKPTSLPVSSYGAIYSGKNSIVIRNDIQDTIYNGIYPGINSRVSFNTIKNSCVFLDDCGGIYLYGENHNTTLSNNVIQSLIGSIDGIPRTRPHTVGIYLDVVSSNV